MSILDSLLGFGFSNSLSNSSASLVSPERMARLHNVLIDGTRFGRIAIVVPIT